MIRTAPLLLLLLLLCCLLAPLPARAERAVLPGLSTGDDRQVVDVGQAPWNAVVKVQTNTGGRCTGTLVAPRTVLTAAHCLYNRRTRRLLAAESLHVLFGYARGELLAHARVVSYQAGLGEAEQPGGPTLGRDWALLRLDSAPDLAPLPLLAGPDPGDAALTAAGFSQDRAHLLMADADCRWLEPPGTGVRRHDCAVTRGTSGGPLLVRTPAGWRVAGLNIAAGRGANLGLPVRVFAGHLGQ